MGRKIKLQTLVHIFTKYNIDEFYRFIFHKLAALEKILCHSASVKVLKTGNGSRDHARDRKFTFVLLKYSYEFV